MGTVSPERMAGARESIESIGTDFHVIGMVSQGEPNVNLRWRGQSGSLIKLDSQRFTADSWFTAGIESYITTLVEAPYLEPDN